MSDADPFDRRAFLALGGGALAAMAACNRSPAAPAPDAAPPADARVVRVASVKTAVEGDVLPQLLGTFEAQSAAQSGLRVELTTGEKVYDRARAGDVDLVVSHYGHHDAEAFVMEGLGEWPRMIFSNQMALVGPRSDPAGVRGLEDAGEAFRRIAEKKATFVVNHIDGVRYLTEILWHAAGRPDRATWLVDEAQAKDSAILRASELGAYSLWGLTPFLRLGATTKLELEPLVLGDPLLQRMLVAVIVKPGGARRVNVAGATALQTFLLEPSTQAKIRGIR